MNREGIELLAQRLNALAELFDKKPLTKSAMQIWVDTLRDFRTERVLDILNSWPKSHSRFPAPADVWKQVNEVGIGDRERQNFIEREQNKSPDIICDPAVAEFHLAKMRAILAPWLKNKPRVREREPGSDDDLDQRLADMVNP